MTSHWGEMELKICPDGQNKGFGRKSGKRRKEGGIIKKKKSVVMVVENLNEKQLQQKEREIKGNITEIKNVNQRHWRGLRSI